MSCTMRIGCFCKDRNTAECELSAWDNASLALYEHVQKTGQHSRKLKHMGHGMVYSTFWRGEVIPFLPVACGGGLLFGQSRPSSPDRPCQVHPSAGIQPSSPTTVWVLSNISLLCIGVWGQWNQVHQLRFHGLFEGLAFHHFIPAGNDGRVAVNLAHPGCAGAICMSPVFPLELVYRRWSSMHIGHSYFPTPSRELEMTSNCKLWVGPS